MPKRSLEPTVYTTPDNAWKRRKIANAKRDHAQTSGAASLLSADLIALCSIPKTQAMSDPDAAETSLASPWLAQADGVSPTTATSGTFAWMSISSNSPLLSSSPRSFQSTANTSQEGAGSPPAATIAHDPTPSSAGSQRRPGRPVLARLDTSERFKTLGLTAFSHGPGAQNGAQAAHTDTMAASTSPDSTPYAADPSPAPHLASPPKHLRAPQHQHTLSPHAAKASPSDLTLSLRRASAPPSPFTYASSEAAFSVSCILPSFLYLGPDVQSEADVAQLEERGIRRILNMAVEIPDGGAQHLHLGSRFEQYKKIAMRDTVDAPGVQEAIAEACRYIDDARNDDAPVYVHCKAGKSRSVLAVMAYLIHANHWTLRRSYAHVVERRHAVSPNIGFIGELMRFEEKCLGIKESKGLLAGPEDGAEEAQHEGSGGLMPDPDGDRHARSSPIGMTPR